MGTHYRSNAAVARRLCELLPHARLQVDRHSPHGSHAIRVAMGSGALRLGKKSGTIYNRGGLTMCTYIEVKPGAKYSVTQVCALLEIDRHTLQRWTEAGHIKCGYNRHNGRKFYKGSELMRFFNAQAR